MASRQRRRLAPLLTAGAVLCEVRDATLTAAAAAAAASHPRSRETFSIPDFVSENSLSFNGDVFSIEDCRRLERHHVSVIIQGGL